MSKPRKAKLRKVAAFVVHGLADGDEERWWTLPLDRHGLPTSSDDAALAWPAEGYARAAALALWPRAREVCAECWQTMVVCRCSDEGTTPKAGERDEQR